VDDQLDLATALCVACGSLIWVENGNVKDSILVGGDGCILVLMRRRGYEESEGNRQRTGGNSVSTNKTDPSLYNNQARTHY
jgi:hypothetical protein